MLRRVVIIILMAIYLYTLTFNVYLNNFVIGLVLSFVFMKKRPAILFGWEFLFLILGNLFYYVIGQSDLKAFFLNLSEILTCGLYFNFFVGESYNRFKASVLLFVLLLSFSVALMFADRYYPNSVDIYRAKLIGGDIVQSPSGICGNMFTFGYQVAAVSTLAFLYVLLTKKHFLMVWGVFMLGTISIFYGMQRSAFIAFSLASVICVIKYYKAKAIPAIAGAVIIGALFFVYSSQGSNDSQGNILTKNTQNEENGEDRSGLMIEDLKIYSNYPLGLVFYNLEWSDVSKNDPVFSGGLTSHNAYLMFFTYLGPFLGIILLLAVYKNVYLAFKQALSGIHDRRNALFIALCFALFAASINALFHNAWLLNANGPTMFLYFAVVHFSKVYYKNTQPDNLSGLKILAV
jgi:hypothetical protein